MLTEVDRRRSTFGRDPFGAQDILIAPTTTKEFTSALPDTDSPWRLTVHDAGLLIKNSCLIPSIFGPPFSFARNPMDELYVRHWSNIISISRQVFLFFYTIVLFALLGTVLVFGVAIVFFPPQGYIVEIFIFVLAVIAWFVLTRPARYTTTSGAKFPNETWLFVNGVMTDRGSLILNCERLAGVFQRQIIGIHNRTFGPVFDVLECMIQRDFGYTADDVRDLYAATKKELLDKENKRVVLVAHSQGGIVASMVVDRLLDTLGNVPLNKLEVYTFGSAANHMHDGHILKCIEHFANEYDFFARSGVLAYRPLMTAGNRFDGEVYVDIGRSGHLLNMHYLNQDIGMIFAPGRPAAAARMATYLDGGGGV